MDFFKGLRNVLSGDIIMDNLTKRWVRFIIFVFVIMLLYNVNRFHGIYVYREISKSEEHIEKLRAEGVAVQSELLKKTNRRKSVLSLLESKGSTLKELKRPAHKIIYKVRKSKGGRLEK
jgi:hypothetical protein